jgi:hypothetical protein
MWLQHEKCLSNKSFFADSSKTTNYFNKNHKQLQSHYGMFFPPSPDRARAHPAPGRHTSDLYPPPRRSGGTVIRHVSHGSLPAPVEKEDQRN